MRHKQEKKAAPTAETAWVNDADLATEFEQIRRLAAHASNLTEQLNVARAPALSRIFRIVKAVENDRPALERAAVIAGITLSKRDEKNLYYTFLKALFPQNKSAETLSDYAAALKRASDWRLTDVEVRGYLEAHGPYSLMMGRHRPASKVTAPTVASSGQAATAGSKLAGNPPKNVSQPAPAPPASQQGPISPASPSQGQSTPAPNGTGTAGAGSGNTASNAVPSSTAIPLGMAAPSRASGATAINQPGLGVGRFYDAAKFGGHNANASLNVVVDKRGHFWVKEVTSFTPRDANQPQSSGGDQEDGGGETDLSDLVDNLLHFPPRDDDVMATAPTAEEMARWDFDGVTTEQNVFRHYVNTLLNNAQVTERLQGADGEFTVRRTRPTNVRISVVNGDIRVAITIGVNISPVAPIAFNGWVKPRTNYDAALTCLELGCAALHQAIKELAGPEGNPGSPLRWQGNLDGLLLSNSAGLYRWLPNERRRMEDGSVPACPVSANPAVVAEDPQSGAGQ